MFRRGVRRYLEEERDDGRCLWFFVHIPKTAGTSFRSELARKLRPDCNIFLNAPGDRPHHLVLEDATRAFISRMETERYRFASGHLPRALFLSVKNALPQTRLMVMLRDPVARIVSSYRYQSSPAHPPHAAFRSRYPRPEDFVADPAAQNEMVRFLAGSRIEPVEALGKRINGTFSFVGLAEAYDLSVRLLFALLGERRGPSLHLNRADEPQASVPPDLAAEIRRCNARDVELYEFFRSRYAAVTPELLRVLDGDARVDAESSADLGAAADNDMREA
jgi:hypothetical protein